MAKSTPVSATQFSVFDSMKDEDIRHLPDPERVNILVVDDIPDKLKAYQIVLEELGQNLVTVHSGEEALKQVLRQEFAVILLDVNMPGMDGFETAALIRKRKKSSRTPIIFLTAFTDELRVNQGYASGAVDYLPTPVMPEVLKAKVRVFIELFQMRRQAAMQAEEHARRTAAEEADRRKDEFLGMLGHELRNPLGPIKNAVKLLQMTGGSADEQTKQLYDIIGRQVSHMARLIDDLLDATRLACGKVLLKKDLCDIARLVRQTTQDYQSVFEASNIELVTHVPNVPVWVEGDPTRLVQAVGNLLHNAHKFTEPFGKVTVTMMLEKNAQTPHMMAKITVRDTGIGIAPDMLDHVFDVFRQAEQGLDRNRGGLGLGLTLVKGLVELHNGDVSVKSEGLGKGAEFILRFPVESTASNVRSTSNVNPIGSKKTYRILVIEDNQDAAESARLLLKTEGHEVRTAATGQDGLDLARSFKPQIVLCDIGLPGMDGYQVVRELRKDPESASVYAIALTGYGRDEDQRQAYQAGFNLHLTKPIAYPSLQKALYALEETTAG
ncbi:MAG: hybrid sensor histidine kinase/response regulator [Proteobacteria bacterium]|nr:hybrid sensor histidine kinase/response regulator [Pseudomonadota bacterium]